MSNKRMTRSTSNKMIAGVCAGMADYFDLDPTVVRVGYIIAAFLSGLGLIAYIVLALVMPVE